jgi:hypothetical protein
MDDFDVQSSLTPLSSLSHFTHSVHAPGTPDESAMPHLVIGIKRVKASESGSVIRLGGNLDESNWIVWQAKIRTALETCGVLEYITGAVERPNFSIDPQGWRNWGSNDAFTRMQIQCNLMDAQMVHVNQCKSALEMWRSLEGVHDNRGHQALVVYMRTLYRLAAEEGDNIIDHLNKMQEGHERINLMGDARFYIPDTTFKLLICQSLPPSWDNYMLT